MAPTLPSPRVTPEEPWVTAAAPEQPDTTAPQTAFAYTRRIGGGPAEVSLFDSSGQQQWVPASEAQARVSQGWKPETRQEYEARRYQEQLDDPAVAFAGGLTEGVLGPLMALGGMEGKTGPAINLRLHRELMEENPIAGTLGQIVGIVGSALPVGAKPWGPGSSFLQAGAGSPMTAFGALGELAERGGAAAAARLVGGLGSKAAQKAAQVAVTATLRGAAEGALLSASANLVDQLAAGRPVSAAELAKSTAIGSAFGGALSLAGVGILAGAKAARGAIRRAAGVTPAVAKSYEAQLAGVEKKLAGVGAERAKASADLDGLKGQWAWAQHNAEKLDKVQARIVAQEAALEQMGAQEAALKAEWDALQQVRFVGAPRPMEPAVAPPAPPVASAPARPVEAPLPGVPRAEEPFEQVMQRGGTQVLEPPRRPELFTHGEPPAQSGRLRHETQYAQSGAPSFSPPIAEDAAALAARGAMPLGAVPPEIAREALESMAAPMANRKAALEALAGREAALRREFDEKLRAFAGRKAERTPEQSAALKDWNVRMGLLKEERRALEQTPVVAPSAAPVEGGAREALAQVGQPTVDWIPAINIGHPERFAQKGAVEGQFLIGGELWVPVEPVTWARVVEKGDRPGGRQRWVVQYHGPGGPKALAVKETEGAARKWARDRGYSLRQPRVGHPMAPGRGDAKWPVEWIAVERPAGVEPPRAPLAPQTFPREMLLQRGPLPESSWRPGQTLDLSEPRIVPPEPAPVPAAAAAEEALAMEGGLRSTRNIRSPAAEAPSLEEAAAQMAVVERPAFKHPGQRLSEINLDLKQIDANKIRMGKTLENLKAAQKELAKSAKMPRGLEEKIRAGGEGVKKLLSRQRSLESVQDQLANSLRALAEAGADDGARLRWMLRRRERLAGTVKMLEHDKSALGADVADAFKAELKTLLDEVRKAQTTTFAAAVSHLRGIDMLVGAGAGYSAGDLQGALVGLAAGGAGRWLLARFPGSANAAGRLLAAVAPAAPWAGRVTGIEAVRLLAQSDVDQMRDEAAVHDPQTMFAMALEGYARGGLSQQTAEELARFQAARLALLREVLGRNNRLEIANTTDALEDPRRIFARLKEWKARREDVLVLQRVFPLVYQDLFDAARELLARSDLSAAQRRQLTMIAAPQVWGQNVKTLLELGQAKEKRQPPTRAGESRTGAMMQTESQRIQREAQKAS